MLFNWRQPERSSRPRPDAPRRPSMFERAVQPVSLRSEGPEWFASPLTLRKAMQFFSSIDCKLRTPARASTSFSFSQLLSFKDLRYCWPFTPSRLARFLQLFIDKLD